VQAQSVDAISGARWIAAGFGLFRLKPLVWVALAAAWLVIALALMAVPTLGQLVLYLLTPALGAGLLLGCQALEQGDDLRIGHLFAGIRSHPAPLVTIGGVYLVGNVLIFGAFMLLGGGKIIAAALERAADPTGPPPDVPTDPLLAVLLLLPLFMAVIFAPALVVFRGVAPLEAMKMSFLACGKNLLTILIFAVLSALLALLAMLPYGLGTLIWIPVYAGAVYRGYQELFGSERPAHPTPP
jgi:uncharacterized membrane protein